MKDFKKHFDALSWWPQKGAFIWFPLFQRGQDLEEMNLEGRPHNICYDVTSSKT